MGMRNRLIAVSTLVVALGGADLLWSSPAAATTRAYYCSDEQVEDMANAFYESCPNGGWGEGECFEDGFWYADFHCYGSEQ